MVAGWVGIIRTMGKGITDIESPQGFAAESGATSVILASTHLGFALSTTQVCSGAILGSGLGRRLAEVRWGVAGRMAMAWLLTLPSAAAVGALAASVSTRGDAGVLVTALAALAVAAGIYAASRRAPVDSRNVNEVPERRTESAATAA
ncbi:hypothetical protein GCM10010191_48740 [Actinomadura vinacea]|uniref:Inorganic phosphate transporter n=1 Tax=Actinomadura vinacea TaxID=115336 RepID=A0ABP5WKL9_9ACTN